MKNILLLTEDTLESGKLITAAFDIARQCHANLILCKKETLIFQPKHVMATYGSSGPEENETIDVFQEAELLKEKSRLENVNSPEITFIYPEVINVKSLRELVKNLGIWLLIMKKPEIDQLRNCTVPSRERQIINKINCPLLLIPDHGDYSIIKGIGHLTDLRFCDSGIIKFLKVFNTYIYVTHITAPGLVPIDESYAQVMLANEIAVKTNYRKLFLRNIKTNRICAGVNDAYQSLDIKLIACFNHNQSVLERIWGAAESRIYRFQELPFLIFPYLNWYNQPSFYE